MNWSKASNTNIDNYKTHLDYYLCHFKIPQLIKNCNNFLCKSHNDQILQILNDLLNIMQISSNETIPIQTIRGNTKCISGWNTHVRPYKDKSIFANDMWKQAGRPISGPLADMRKFARAKYHRAIKQVKTHKYAILLNNTAKQLYTKSYTFF